LAEQQPQQQFILEYGSVQSVDEIERMINIVYGAKGVGKTQTAMGFPGKIVVLSFDNKALRIWKRAYKCDPRISICDAVKYFSHDKKKYVESGSISFKYLEFVLETLIKQKEHPNWIIFDGTEILLEIAELAMRFNMGLSAFQGIANLNVWKDRKLNIRSLHDLALKASVSGIIYTTYAEKDEIIDEGTLVSKKDVPHWFDIIMREVDNVFHVTNTFEEGRGQRVKLHVVTAKTEPFVTGMTYDITGKSIQDIVKFPDERTKAIENDLLK